MSSPRPLTLSQECLPSEAYTLTNTPVSSFHQHPCPHLIQFSLTGIRFLCKGHDVDSIQIVLLLWRKEEGLSYPP